MDLQKLVAIFERAQSGASPGDEYAGNPLKWPVVRGVKAVADEYEARIKDLEGALEELLLAFEFERGRIKMDDELQAARAQHDYAQGYLQAWREFSAHFGSNAALEKRREAMDRQSGEALRIIVRAMRAP